MINNEPWLVLEVVSVSKWQTFTYTPTCCHWICLLTNKNEDKRLTIKTGNSMNNGQMNLPSFYHLMNPKWQFMYAGLLISGTATCQNMLASVQHSCLTAWQKKKREELWSRRLILPHQPSWCLFIINDQKWPPEQSWLEYPWFKAYWGLNRPTLASTLYVAAVLDLLCYHVDSATVSSGWH